MQRIIRNQRYSKSRIRKIAADVMANEQEELNVIPGLDIVQSNSTRPIVRIVWLLIIATCFTTCVYQVGSRIVYCLGDPTVVDVFFEELGEGKMPVLILASRDTEEYNQYLKKNPLPQKRGCYPNFREILGLNNTGLVVDEFWRMMNTTTVVKDAYLAKSGHFFRNLSIDDYNGVGGVCTALFYGSNVEQRDSSKKLRVSLDYPKIENDSCSSPLMLATIQSGEEKNYDLTSMVNVAVFRKTMIAVSMKRYQFLNTTKRVCVDRKTYEDCEASCYELVFSDVISRCRFPFIKNADLPYCKPSTETLQDYDRVVGRLMQFNPRTMCNCPTPCTKTQQTNFVHSDVTDTQSMELYIESSIVRAMRERFAYGFLPLLCDIGGNLGLYLGLSLLSTAKIISHYTQSFGRRNTFHLKKSYMYKKVCSVLNQERQKRKIGTKQQFNLPQLHYLKHRKQNVKKYFRVFITGLAIVLCIYQTCDRIAYFFKYPTIVSVEVVEDDNVQLPSIVTCFITTEMFVDKKPLGKTLNYSCSDSNFLSLLDPPYIYERNVGKLWEDAATIGLHKNSFPMVQYGTLTTFPTIFGNCTKASIGLLQYSALSASIVSELPRMVECSCSYKIFVIPEGKDLNLKHYIDIPCAGHSTTKFVRQTLIKLNVPKSPCMQPEEANSCIENCYWNKMLPNITCRLPFMTDLALELCPSSESAYRTRSVYLKAYMNTDPVKDCSCQPSCKETIFLPYTTYDDASQNASTCVESYGLQSNLREIIRQNRAFTLIKLLCDMGSNLGVMLGMSMLSLIQIMQRTVYSSALAVKSYSGN